MFEPVKGTRDFPPDIKILRKEIFDKVEEIFRRFGYDPIETPIVEYWDTLKGKYGEEAEKKLIWRFRLPFSDREYALRYDHTVPLARFYSRFQFKLPFKRYVIDRVYRYDEPQRSRYREFYQADYDIVGSDFPESDAEVILVADKVLSELGFKDYKIRINDRGILDELFINYLEIEREKINKVYNAIDKLDKIGIKGVKKELEKILDKEKVDKIIELISLKGEEALNKINSIFEIKNWKNYFYKTRIDYLYKVLELVNSKNILFDLSLVRGLDYYTGIVFEGNIGEEKISVAGGGRYDNLIGIFLGKRIPAVGGSIGIERVIDIGIKSGIFKIRRKTYIDLIVIYFPETFNEAWKIANKLRDIGLNVYIDLNRKDFKGQIEYSVDKNVRFLLIVGKKELENKKLILQDREKREKIEINIDEIEKIKEMIEKMKS